MMKRKMKPEGIKEEREEARRAKEEKAAALEFENWKGEFCVDAQGTTEEVQGGNQDFLSQFVEYIKECINWIASLESIVEEMNAVAEYIKRQGRVSISHLASKSNQFIDLEPKVQHQLSEEFSGMEDISVSYVYIDRRDL